MTLRSTPQWRRLAGLLLFCAAIFSSPAGLAASREAGPIALSATQISFSPFLPGSDRYDELVWRGGIEIESDDKRFGGYSGLAFSDDGTELVAVSDRGWWLRAAVTYEDDRLAGIGKASTAPLLAPGGGAIRRYNQRDSEAIGIYDKRGIKGWLMVAMERNERILLYNFGRYGFRARPRTIRLPPSAGKAKFNKELEAVGRFGPGSGLNGTIIALSEQFLDADGNIRGWLIGGRHRGEISVQRSNDYDITDLAILPDGDVLILERRFNAIALSGMRIRRIALRDIKPGATLRAKTLLEANQPLKSIDNMEGIAVHLSPKGELRISLISDDNFNTLQRTLLLQFAFPKKEQN